MHLFLMYISSVFFKRFPRESINAYALHSAATQVNVYPSKSLQQDNQYEFLLIERVSTVYGASDSISSGLLRLQPRCTYIFQTAHEVVADWGARQVHRVQAAPYVEEIVGAQHGVVLLSVAGGGENPIY